MIGVDPDAPLLSAIEEAHWLIGALTLMLGTPKAEHRARSLAAEVYTLRKLRNKAVNQSTPSELRERAIKIAASEERLRGGIERGSTLVRGHMQFLVRLERLQHEQWLQEQDVEQQRALAQRDEEDAQL